MIFDARNGSPSKPTGECERCGEPIPPERHNVRIYCTAKHSEKARLARRAGKEIVPTPGACAWCGKPINSTPIPMRTCSVSCTQKMYWKRPWAKFLGRSKNVAEDDWRESVAKRLRCDPAHPGLEKIVLQLAKHDRLNIYVGRRGHVTAVGDPKVNGGA